MKIAACGAVSDLASNSSDLASNAVENCGVSGDDASARPKAWRQRARRLGGRIMLLSRRRWRRRRIRWRRSTRAREAEAVADAVGVAVAVLTNFNLPSTRPRRASCRASIFRQPPQASQSVLSQGRVTLPSGLSLVFPYSLPSLSFLARRSSALLRSFAMYVGWLRARSAAWRHVR